MDQNLPYTPTLSPLVSTPSPSAFTRIKDLLTRSWERVQKHLLQLFLLTVLLFAAGVVLFIVMAAVLFMVGFFSPVTSGLPYSASAVGMVALITIPAVAVIALIGMLGLQIATILLLSETQMNLPLIQLYKLALKKAGPLLMVSLISALIVIGGLAVFIVPGILFSILLSLASYFVVLDNITPMEAIKKSVFVVSKSFGAIFVRMLALIGISFLAGIIFNLLSSQSGSLSILVSLASMVFNLLFGWVSVAYTMFLFQEAKKVAGEGRGTLMWMAVVAAIGWAVISGGGLLIYRALPSSTTTTIPPLQLNNTLPLKLPALSSPPPSLRPATPSASIKATPTPKPTATPKTTPKPTASPANR